MKIFEIFEEHVTEVVEDIKDEISYREDLEVLSYDFKEDESGELLVIESKINESIIEIQVVCELNDESESTVTLTAILNEEDYAVWVMTYTNGGAEYDEENGYYMPTSYNEFSKGGKEEFYKKVIGLIVDQNAQFGGNGRCC